ncbi:MAG: thioredoxin domain-containing protein [Hyphomonadaceae bacterium]
MTFAINGSLIRRAGGLAAGVMAMAVLAACGGESAGPQTDFKPVPVDPVLGDAPQGAADAPVEMVEYASLSCSHCRDFARQVYPRIKREYIDTGKLRYIYRDMSIDPQAFDITLATITRCKGPELHHVLVDEFFGKFMDIMESARDGKAATVLSDIVTKHGMTWDEAVTCMDHTPALREAIVKSGDRGEQELKAADPTVQGRLTPTIFVDGKLLKDITYEGVKAAIEAKLNPDAAPAEGAAPATEAPAQ